MTAYARILRAVVEADDGHDAADAVVALGETRYLCGGRLCDEPCPDCRRVLVIDDPEPTP